MLYRNVEEKDQRSVSDHGDVKHHIIVDKTAKRWTEKVQVKVMVDSC